MSKRQSIYTESFSHRNPIPAACRLGNLVVSGIVTGLDPADPKPTSLDEQCRAMFARVEEILREAGCTTDHVIKLNVWMQDPSDRSALNQEWLQMFPDPAARPARQVVAALLDRGKLIQCDFLAWNEGTGKA